MTVVDTCVLSSLAKIERLDLLHKSFENIIATLSVVNEIERVGEAKFVKKIKKALYFEVIEEDKFIFVVSLSQKELQYAHNLKVEYGLSIAYSECYSNCKDEEGDFIER
ncbi:hypothetical protein ES705_07320 [subsurface metagenome]